MICTACKEVVPGGYAYCLNCGLYLGEPTIVLPPAERATVANPTPPESAPRDAPTTSSSGNRLPWLMAGGSFTLLLIVLMLGASYFFLTNDQQTQQPTTSASPASGTSRASLAPEEVASPSVAPRKQERPQPTVAPLPSPRVLSLSQDSTTAPRVGTDEPNKIYSGNDVSSKARIVSKPQPQYTEAARQNQITGKVILRAVFTSGGEVTNITAHSSLPYGLTERAIAAARQIKFVPATRDGQPVSMYIQLEYNFNLY